MKHIHFLCFALLMFITTSVTKAQVSQIVYASDGMSGELVLRAADFNPDSLFIWIIDIPDNVPVLVTRTNNTYIGPNAYVYENDTRRVVDKTNIGIYTDTIWEGQVITVVLDHFAYPITKDPAMSIRFSVINQSFASGTVMYGGDVEIPNGTLTVSGHHNSMGIDVSAVLGGKFSDYTCFGSPRGGRIRGSNEGYLVLEGNPLGYGTNTNVYINRYVGGDVLMTSSIGKVGIGTDNPQEKLHISGYIRGNGPAGSLVVSTEYGKLTMGAQDTSSVTFSTDRHLFRFTEDVRLDKGLSARNKLELYRSIPNSPNSTYVNIKLDTGGDCFFLNNGNIGIGTNAPQYKLDVNGTIRAKEMMFDDVSANNMTADILKTIELTSDVVRSKEIIVNINTGADFVFGEDYQLLPLQELRTFVEENQHLPEIQPAADMQEKGVSVNDFQIQLLQKIEELTLYILQQDEQIQYLQQQINNLQK